MSVSKIKERLEALERETDTETEDTDAYFEAAGILDIDIDLGDYGTNELIRDFDKSMKPILDDFDKATRNVFK